MAEQPKMTEFEMALEAAEKVQTQPKAKVHWPAPGGAGVAYPSPPRGAKPQQEKPSQDMPPGAHAGKEEGPAKSKPPMALIAVAVVLVLVAAAVFYFMKKGGGDETPASDETAVEEGAVAAPKPAGSPAAAPKPAGAPAPAPAPSGGPKASTGTPAAAQPTEPAPVKEPEVAKVTQPELDQLVQGLSYQEVVGIIGGEGVLFTDTVENGNRIWVYVWPTEGLKETSVGIVFINGVLDKTNLRE